MFALPGPYKHLSIGLLGGSFNPAHAGHLHVAETAMRRLKLDWVWWIVARGNPLKLEHGDYDQRCRSVDTLIKRQSRMRLTRLENAFEFTYTIETLEYLMVRCPEARFVWLMGGDNLAGFARWRGWQEIAHSIPIAIVARKFDKEETQLRRSAFVQRFQPFRVPERAAARLPFSTAPAWTYLRAPLNPLSSTAIRRAAREA